MGGYSVAGRAILGSLLLLQHLALILLLLPLTSSGIYLHLLLQHLVPVLLLPLTSSGISLLVRMKHLNHLIHLIHLSPHSPQSPPTSSGISLSPGVFSPAVVSYVELQLPCFPAHLLHTALLFLFQFVAHNPPSSTPSNLLHTALLLLPFQFVPPAREN